MSDDQDSDSGQSTAEAAEESPYEGDVLETSKGRFNGQTEAETTDSSDDE